MDASVFMKTYINRTFVDWKRSSVFASMVFQLVHVLAEQFDGFLVPEQPNCCWIAEEAGAKGIPTEYSFRGGVENQTNSLLALL